MIRRGVDVYSKKNHHQKLATTDPYQYILYNEFEFPIEFMLFCVVCSWGKRCEVEPDKGMGTAFDLNQKHLFLKSQYTVRFDMN